MIIYNHRDANYTSLTSNSSYESENNKYKKNTKYWY